MTHSPSNPLSQRIDDILNKLSCLDSYSNNDEIEFWKNEVLEAKQEILKLIEESKKHLALECPRCGGTTVPTGYKSIGKHLGE